MKKHLHVAAAALVISASASSVLAGMTQVGKIRPDEQTVGQILAHTYGGSFTQNGDDFYNGSITARRVDDYLPTVCALNLSTMTVGDADDQIFSKGKYTAKAIAKFSMNTQSFGIQDTFGTQHSLLDVTGYGYDVSGSAATLTLTSDWNQLYRAGTSGTQFSLTQNNEDARDHLITYEIQGLAGVKGGVWLTFWEDMNRTSLTPKRASHSDFNDLVVELRGEPVAVPLPAPVLAGGLMLIGTMLGMSRRKRVRAIA